jgi:hypothetical protein
MEGLMMQGKGPVEKQIRNADRVDLMPWRPKISRASDITLKWAAGAYGAILLFNFLLKSTPQGVEAAVIAGVVLNCWKQYQLFPTDQFAELQQRLEGGWRNLFRCSLGPQPGSMCSSLVPPEATNMLEATSAAALKQP